MAMPKRKAFVAYASRDQKLAEALREGVRRANALPQPYDYRPWQFNDIAGQPLISPILENIDESAVIVADVTFLNLNVVYEIGYAIGKKKRAFLVRNGILEGQKALARTTGIFDTLGYVEYPDAQGLARLLAAYIEERPLAAKRHDANEDDNSAGLVLDTDVVAWLIKRLRQFSDLRPRGTRVRQGNRLLRRNDRAVLEHFEIEHTHTYPILSRNRAG